MVGGDTTVNTRLIIGAFIILIGISILFDLNLFKIIFPLLLIWIGVQVILGKDGGGNAYVRSDVQEDSIKRVLIFSGINQKISSSNFKGGEIVTVFGGGDIDLSEAKTKEKNIKLELVAVLGGLRIQVPQNWAIQSEGIGILGGFENRTNGKDIKKTVEVSIKGVAVLGGVEISN